MNTDVHDLTSSTRGMNPNTDIPDDKQQPRLTLRQRQEIAKDRFRKARQKRKDRRDALLAKLSPRSVLRPECLRTQSNPDPPTLWYGFPLNPETYRGYIVKKGNPDRLNVDVDAHFLVMPALKLLREVFETKRICDILPLHPYSHELYRMIAFKCSKWPSAQHPVTKADERMAAMLREELGLPEGRPCLWHFDNQHADKVFALYDPYGYEPPVTWDDLLDSEISDLELSDSDSDSDDESEF